MFCTTFFVLPKCFLYRSDITLIVMCTHYFATNMSFLVVKLKISTKLTIFNNWKLQYSWLHLYRKTIVYCHRIQFAKELKAFIKKREGGEEVSNISSKRNLTPKKASKLGDMISLTAGGFFIFIHYDWETNAASKERIEKRGHIRW